MLRTAGLESARRLHAESFPKASGVGVEAKQNEHSSAVGEER